MPTCALALAHTHTPAYTHIMSDATPAVDVIVNPRPHPPAFHNAIVRSPEAARQLARARWDTAERMGRKALAAAAGADGWAAGVYEVVKAQAGAALSGKPGTSGAASFVLRAAGLLRDRADQVQPGAGADTNDLTLMLTAFRRWRDAHPDAAADLARLAAAGGDGPGSTAPDVDE